MKSSTGFALSSAIREATGLGGLPAVPDAPSRLVAGKPGGQASLAGKR